MQVDAGHRTDYQVSADGRVVIGIPSNRPTCGVYLFDWIKVSGGSDPSGAWMVTVSSGGKALKKVTVKQVRELPRDSEGYHLLNVPG